LKSLAHPDWPYVGTPHEWRGFADSAEYPDSMIIFLPPSQYDAWQRAGMNMRCFRRVEPIPMQSAYQKLSFGPELT
jgi:hypothetical protein